MLKGTVNSNGELKGRITHDVVVCREEELLKLAIKPTTDKAKVHAITDSAEYRMLNLKAHGESTQNGTPTPNNPQPIESIENVEVKVLGKNLLDESEAITRTNTKY